MLHFICSIVCGLIQALSFAISIEGKLSYSALIVPGAIASIILGGLIGGFIMCPVVMWMLKGRKLVKSLTSLYAFVAIATIILNIFEVKYSAFISLALVICVVTAFNLLFPNQSN